MTDISAEVEEIKQYSQKALSERTGKDSDQNQLSLEKIRSALKTETLPQLKADAEAIKALKNIASGSEQKLKIEACIILLLLDPKSPDRFSQLSTLFEELQQFEQLEKSCITQMLSTICKYLNEESIEDLTTILQPDVLKLLLRLGNFSISMHDDLSRENIKLMMPIFERCNMLSGRYRDHNEITETFIQLNLQVILQYKSFQNELIPSLKMMKDILQKRRYVAFSHEVQAAFKNPIFIQTVMDILIDTALPVRMMKACLSFLASLLDHPELESVSALFSEKQLHLLLPFYLECNDDDIVVHCLSCFGALISEKNLSFFLTPSLLSTLKELILSSHVEIQEQSVRLIFKMTEIGQPADLWYLVDHEVILPLAKAITRGAVRRRSRNDKDDDDDDFSAYLVMLIFTHFLNTFEEEKKEIIEQKIVELGWKEVVGAIEDWRGCGDASTASAADELLALL